MTLNEILEKYPRAKHFLETHPGMSLDQALVFTDVELKKIEQKESW